MTNRAVIPAAGQLDYRSSQDLVARVRAAMRNNQPGIEIAFAGNAVISSGELLGFLVTVARYLSAEGHELRLSGGNARLRQIVDMVGLGTFLVEESA
jgi:anti-anti-sigma regulatory factor